jgi:hypothetical protein
MNPRATAPNASYEHSLTLGRLSKRSRMFQNSSNLDPIVYASFWIYSVDRKPKRPGRNFLSSRLIVWEAMWTRNSSKTHWHRSTSRQRTTPWTAGIGPPSIIRVSAVRCSGIERAGNLRYRESPGVPSQIATLSTDQAPTAIGCPHMTTPLDVSNSAQSSSWNGRSFTRIFVDANVKLEPSRWHEGSFAVEDRFARDLTDLLTEEGFDVLDERPQH